MLRTEHFSLKMTKKTQADIKATPLFKNNDSNIVYTDHRKVSCNGGQGVSGHPKVYLEIKEEIGKIDCPYCNKLFVYKNNK